MTAEPQKFLLRVYIASDVAVKVTLTERPKSVEELINMLREKDPDFDGELCCLVDVQDLPEKGTLKVDQISDHNLIPTLIPTTWPDIFPVPTFSYEVEHILEDGNVAFETSGTMLKLTRAQKHNILENMAEVMHKFKPYPSDRDIGMAAEVSGWYGWKTSLKFKMGNFRTKLARSGCVEVSVNTGKRSKSNPENEHPHSNIKRARRAEVNYLPDFPRGEKQDSLEEMRVQIISLVEKREKNLLLIENLMQKTSALHRQEIVLENPLVKTFLEKWPALQIEAQVCAEFQRITNVNLRNQFYVELDRHTPQLVALFRQKAARTGKVSEMLRDILSVYDRTLVLRAIPVYLREEDPRFFKMWNVSIQFIHKSASIRLLKSKIVCLC
uniref:Uncharacterized protein n=1 Tax=Sinocyclocheilus rhinocerous TaxID=307959 RepID=A0A673JJG8_9TELE